MPPKKADTTKKNAGQQKTVQNRVKKEDVEKKVRKLKLKIPLQNVTKKRVIVKQLETDLPMPGKNDIKIKLANEVVKRQFPKKTLFIEDSNILINTTKTNKTVKKNPVLVKRKLVQINKKKPLTQTSEENLKDKDKQKTVTKNISIGLENNSQRKRKNVQKQNAETEADSEKKDTKRPVKLKNTRTVKKLSLVTEDDLKQSKEDTQTTRKSVPKRTLPQNKKSRPGPRTRKKATNDIHEAAKTVAGTPIKSKSEKRVQPQRRLSKTISELSWTKDISSSSTSTCITVSSKDFVRIDKKVPVLKLTNIDGFNKTGEHFNRTDKMNFESNIVHCEEMRGLDTTYQTPMNSSSSSSSSSSSQESCGNVGNTTAMVLDKLASKLKNFDLEIMNWIGYTDVNTNRDTHTIQNKLFANKLLQEERDVILHCQAINRILSEHVEDDLEKENCDSKSETQAETNEKFEPKETENDKAEKNTSNFDAKASQSEEKFVHNSTFNDEDDALSLYAESLTEMESPRNWKQMPRENNAEYVPLPKKGDEVFKKPATVLYKPTKISKTPKNSESTCEIAVCEKSNADSTSMYKENNVSAAEEIMPNYEDRIGEGGKNIPSSHCESILPSSNQKPINFIHSYVFRGVCFFFLKSTCTHPNCKFPHTFLDNEDLVKRLKHIDDQMFREEYILLRNWPQLRRNYGIHFVNDCVRRKLTRVLIEMALDFMGKISNKEDSALAVEAIETTLVYLNDVELHTCGDLLKQNVKSDIILCDVFLDTIAKSQNFSRFKQVFVNLTNFVCELGRTFQSSMASYVLERVCILPYDKNLAQALVKIIKNTDSKIFYNSMMKSFKKQLLYSNTQLYDELGYLKGNSASRVSNCYNSPLNDDEGLNSYSEKNRKEQLFTESTQDMRYSPDTTNLDSLNKTIESKFTRTLDINKLKVYNDLPNSGSSGSDDKYTFRGSKRWDHRNDKRIPMNTPRLMPLLRTDFKRRFNQPFGDSPSKFPRRNGRFF